MFDLIHKIEKAPMQQVSSFFLFIIVIILMLFSNTSSEAFACNHKIELTPKCTQLSNTALKEGIFLVAGVDYPDEQPESDNETNDGQPNQKKGNKKNKENDNQTKKNESKQTQPATNR